jgi:hypothetical protein
MTTKRTNLISIIAIISVALLSFGLLISKLGFYLDDWVIIQAFNQDGIQGIINYAVGDSRPVVAWVWIVGYKLFGSHAIGWQLYSLFFRLLTVFAFWLILKKFFPKNPSRVLIITLLFFVYPVFKQQPTSIAFAHHWIAFSFFLLSFYLQLVSVDKNKIFLVYIVISLFLNGVQLFTNEYFMAMELARPFILALYLSQQGKFSRKNWKFLLWSSLPYLLLFGGYIVWRFFLLDLPVEDRNTPELLLAFLTTPVYAIRRWLEMFLQSFIEQLLGAWYHALDPLTLVFKPFSDAINWVVIVVSALCIVPFLLWFRSGETEDTNSQDKWNWMTTGMLVGFVLMVLGFIPGWGLGRTIVDASGVYNDRFGLVSALGSSLFLVSFFSWLIPKKKAVLLLFGLMISIGIGFQYRSLWQYAKSWDMQKEFAWQLKTRAPDIEENTAVISNGVIAAFVGSWADTSALNQMYDPNMAGETNAYWMYTPGKVSLDYLAQFDYMVTERNKFLAFNGNLNDSIVIMKPVEGMHCLWVIDADDVQNPYLDSTLSAFLQFAHPERILQNGSQLYPSYIWGNEREQDWCYHYLKAELAVQVKDWDVAVSHYDKATEKGFSPMNAVEYAPFIEAYAMSEQWDAATALTETALHPVQSPYYHLENYYCTIWQRIDAQTDSSEANTAVREMMTLLGCK